MTMVFANITNDNIMNDNTLSPDGLVGTSNPNCLHKRKRLRELIAGQSHSFNLERDCFMHLLDDLIKRLSCSDDSVASLREERW
jgi:hypothetical protein